MTTIQNSKFKIGSARAFTLIELLVVIAIMGVLAGLAIPVLGAAKVSQYKKVARGELERLGVALDNYKAKYGTYPPGNANNNPLMPQLYYELSGTTLAKIAGVDSFVTLDGGSQIPVASVNAAYGVGGFINCTKGADDEVVKAQNYLSGLKSNQFFQNVPNNGVPTTVLITAVGGPDVTYQPLSASGLNPFRYQYPGVNNPNSYDLWVKLSIKGKTWLICNWSQQALANSPLP